MNGFTDKEMQAALEFLTRNAGMAGTVPRSPRINPVLIPCRRPIDRRSRFRRLHYLNPWLNQREN